MAAKAKTQKTSRLADEMLATANEMHALGIMDDADFAKITMRQIDKAHTAVTSPLTGEEIRGLREQAKLSQAVFARYLNMTVGLVSKLERGAEISTGPMLVLLTIVPALDFLVWSKSAKADVAINVIRKRGIEVIL